MSQRLIDKQARKQKKNGKESPTQQNTKLTGGGGNYLYTSFSWGGGGTICIHHFLVR